MSGRATGVSENHAIYVDHSDPGAAVLDLLNSECTYNRPMDVGSIKPNFGLSSNEHLRNPSTAALVAVLIAALAML